MITSVGGFAVVFVLIYFFLKETPQFSAMQQMKAHQKAGNLEAVQAISDATGLKITTEAPLKMIFNKLHRRNNYRGQHRRCAGVSDPRLAW